MDIFKYIKYNNGKYMQIDIIVPGINIIQYSSDFMGVGYKCRRTDYGIRNSHKRIEYAIKNSLEIDEESAKDIYRIVNIIEYKYRRLMSLQLSATLPINHAMWVNMEVIRTYYSGMDNIIDIKLKMKSKYYNMISYASFQYGNFKLYGVDNTTVLVKTKVNEIMGLINEMKIYTVYACEEVYKILFEDIEFAPIYTKSARNI